VSRQSDQNGHFPGSPDLQAARLATGQWGVLDDGELRACGLSAKAVRARRRNGRLHLVHPGVYSMGHDGLTLNAQFLAAVKAAGPGAALSHRSAAALWDLFPWDEEWLPEVTIPMRGSREIPGITIHRTRRPFDVIRFDAIPVTTPARALIDVSPVLPFKPLRRAVREAMALKRITVKELVGSGSPAIDRILADGYVPTRNEFEDAVLDLVTEGGFTRPDVNKTIVVGGKRTTPDFRWPEQHLVVEADGAQWHDHKLAREDDAERQARLEAAGERVLRVTWHQVVAQPGQTIARLRSAGAPRCTED
jgi:very-short-patch-repair endonuclease